MAKLILYVFNCPTCGDFEKLAYQDEEIYCHGLCKRIPSFRGSIHVFHEYYNQSLGKMITGAHQLRDEYKKNNLVMTYPGDTFNPSKITRERKKKAEEASRKSIRNYLKSGISDMIIEGKPILKIRETIESEKKKEAMGL